MRKRYTDTTLFLFYIPHKYSIVFAVWRENVFLRVVTRLARSEGISNLKLFATTYLWP